MKLAQTKGMVLPALGIGAGMVASPKVQGISPFLSKHPYITPIIFLLIALALLKYAKARPFALGLGAIALVFLAVSIWSKVKGVTTGAPADTVDYSKIPGAYQNWLGQWMTPSIDPSTGLPFGI